MAKVPRVKKGDRVTFKDGFSGEVYSTFTWVDGKAIATIKGEDPNNRKRHYLEDIVSVNGAPVGGDEKKAPEVKRWAEGEMKHYETRGVLAARYDFKQLRTEGRPMLSHAVIPGQQMTVCGKIREEDLSDVNERHDPTCRSCLSRVSKMKRN